MAVQIIASRCPQNHRCPAVKVCPVGALSQRDNNAPDVSTEQCIDCGQCSAVCPKQALVLEND